MSEKLEKATKRRKLHPRDRRSRHHGDWKRNIGAGMRAAKLRRRDAGLMTFTEVSVETCLALYAIKRLVDSGELKAVNAGSHRYIHRAELDRWKTLTGLSAA
jgi:excisionase family DNA binding protein